MVFLNSKFDIQGACFFSAPDILTFSDAIFMCGHDYFDGKHGIFTREGYLIPQAAFYQHTPSVLKGQPNWINPTHAKTFPVIDNAIFVGEPSSQYGHFLTEFVCRLWAVSKIRRGEKLLVRTVEPLSSIFALSWAVDLFSLLDLTIDDFIAPRHPAIVKRLMIPTPGFIEDSYCNRVFAEFCHEIGDRAVHRSELGRELRNQNIYLSRSKLICGTISLVNEVPLEEELRNLGFQVIHPEDYSVADQICFYRNNNIVTGVLGSAFHTSIFTAAPRAIALNLKDTVSLNYRMMDAVNEANIDYYDPIALVDAEIQNWNFYSYKVIADVRIVATHLYELVQAKREHFYVPNMGYFPVSDRMGFKFFRLLNDDKLVLRHDTRTGRVTAAEALDTPEMLLLSTGADPFGSLCFLISSRDDALPMRIDNTELSGPLIPVRLMPRGGRVTLSVAENGNFLRCLTEDKGRWVQSHPNDLAPGFGYDLVGYTEMPASGSRRSRLLAIVSIIFDFSKHANLDFYMAEEPDLVSFVYDMKSLILAR